MTHLGATAEFIQLMHSCKETEWTYECTTLDQANSLQRVCQISQGEEGPNTGKGYGQVERQNPDS